MIIDFHTHIFPSEISKKAVDALKRSSGYENFSDGSAEGLEASMDESGIDYSVNMPVLTRPESFEKTLYHLKDRSEMGRRIFSFAAIHPACENVAQKIDLIRSCGFVGIKLHPFFQNEPVNSPRTKRLVAEASRVGLFTMIHAGTDASFPNLTLSSPEMIVDLLESVRAKNVILAHMGGMGYADEVKRFIVGRDVWLDTSFSMDILGEELFTDMVRRHGAERILFGTDSPWRPQSEYVRILSENSRLSEEEKSKIFYKNAAKILDLKV